MSFCSNTADPWIWLDCQRYPTNQTTRYSYFHKDGEENYTVAQFTKEYRFSQKVMKADLYFSGDTRFRLSLNGKIIATGPVMVGGDWLGNDAPRPDYYATAMTISPDCCTLNFLADVVMMPTQMCEYSKGHGGFMLKAELTFTDGSHAYICTDSTWLSRRCSSYLQPCVFDDRIPPDPYTSAQQIPDIWNCHLAPIPPRAEEVILPTGEGCMTLAAGKIKEQIFAFDKIYAGYVCLEVETEGELHVVANCQEVGETGSQEELIFHHNAFYRGFKLHSAGQIRLKVENRSSRPAKICVKLIATCYPVADCGRIVTSDDMLNKVLDVCTHTLKYCRQSIHLDSPRHCEPLACTGDYYIETLMTLFSFGDMELAKFDIRRTAGLLRNHDGRIFHTTYSLIWVSWLYDVYLFTGEKALLSDCRDALDLLLNRFETYLGQNGLIETPPDYMFVDWIYIDGHSMHHPPKALGQTCLNMFYFKALKTAVEIYDALNLPESSIRCRKKAAALQNAVNTLLYDSEKGMYFEGLNTPTPESLLDTFMPQNTEKRYYLKHSNILAAYSGICDRNQARELIDKIMSDEIPGDYQPYFAHYLLEAVYRNGMRSQYTLPILKRWKSAVESCDKGLVEGFIRPEPTYRFDHSHAWGGTPLYSLPKALLGFEITKPGLQELHFCPDLLGLENAKIEFPTPYGNICAKLKAGEAPAITTPEEIAVFILTKQN